MTDVSGRLSIDQIRAFWTKQAVTFGQSAGASWSDQRVIDLEIEQIVKRLADGDRVLDIGCANGYSTVQFAAQRNLSVTGLDYVPEMIAQANIRLQRLPPAVQTSIAFRVGDITALAEPDEGYDKVVVIRVIINLGNREQQTIGLREAGRVVRRGGLLLLSEATIEGWQSLNRFRREWGMNDIPMPDFNLYLHENEVVEVVSAALDLVEIVNFASTYYVATRVLKPLFVRAIGESIDVADPNMEWNRWASQLPQCGDYGVQKLFVFRKR